MSVIRITFPTPPASQTHWAIFYGSAKSLTGKGRHFTLDKPKKPPKKKKK